VLRIRDLVTFWPPGSGMGTKSRSGSGMNIPGHICESLETIFSVTNTEILCCGSGYGNRNLFDPGSGKEKFGSGIRDKHHGSTTLFSTDPQQSWSGGMKKSTVPDTYRYTHKSWQPDKQYRYRICTVPRIAGSGSIVPLRRYLVTVQYRYQWTKGVNYGGTIPCNDSTIRLFYFWYRIRLSNIYVTSILKDTCF
jgi:hypothetical protein